MLIDPSTGGERDDLAPPERLHVIADILAKGVQRVRDNARRLGLKEGESSQHQEKETTSLALLEPVRPSTSVPSKGG